MKKILMIPALLVVLFLTFINSNSFASGLPFTFSASTPSTAAVAPSTINLANRLPAIRDEFDTLISPGLFNFIFGGIAYSKFIVSSNGWLALAPANMTVLPAYFSSSALPNNSLTTYSGGLPLIAPLWDDDSCDIIQYGVAGNILTVQWSVKWDKTDTGSYAKLMWVTLDGNTGIISFNYSTNAYSQPASASASIGIAGSCNGDFISVTPNNSVPASSASSVTEDSLVILKPVNAKFVFTPAGIVWQGTIDTLFDNSNNWNYCGVIPDCSLDAVIDTTSSGRMPTLTSNQAVRNLTINAGSSLRIKAPVTLNICGDLINNGALIAEPGSSINFTGTGMQSIYGSLTGSNAFANLVITKATGRVAMNSDIDIKNNFTINNSTSVFDFDGNYMKVGGNFTNYNGATTTGIEGSTIEFDGNSNQFYSNTNGDDTICHVTVNNTGGKVYLTGAHSKMNIDSVLNLISGNIVTTPSLEVNLLYGSPSAIQSYSKDSYIDGRLRRKLYGVGSVDFPLGDSLVPNPGLMKGYELVNINFTSSTIIPDLLAWFNIWPSSPPLGPVSSDVCGSDTVSYNSMPLYDNGYWTFQRDSPVFNGTYNVTLYNTGGTNYTGTSELTVAKSSIISPPLNAASWSLTGTCDSTSILSMTKRNLLNNPLYDSTSFNHNYVTAQGIQVFSNSVNEIINSSGIYLIPNPAKKNCSLVLNSNYSDNIRIKIHSITGQVLTDRFVNVMKGENTFPLINENDNFPVGIYPVTIEGIDYIRNIKLVIQ